MQPLFPFAKARGYLNVAGIANVCDLAAPCCSELFGAGGGDIKIVGADDGNGVEWKFDKRDRCEACCTGRIRVCFGITWGN